LCVAAPPEAVAAGPDELLPLLPACCDSLPIIFSSAALVWAACCLVFQSQNILRYSADILSVMREHSNCVAIAQLLALSNVV
jgi:hypothetical protein